MAMADSHRTSGASRSDATGNIGSEKRRNP